MNEELVYDVAGRGRFFPLLLFPGGNDLLAASFPPSFAPKFHFNRVFLLLQSVSLKHNKLLSRRLLPCNTPSLSCLLLCPHP